MKNPGTLVILLTSFWLGGCASVGAFRGITPDEDSLYINGLPPLLQDKHYACGATCVAAVAVFWNVPLTEIRVKHPELPAEMTGLELELLAKELGLDAFAYRGTTDDLQENLRKGRPMIVMIPQPLLPRGDVASSVLLNAWNQWGSKPAHWVVVIGMTKNQAVIIHDPASGPMVVKREAFLSWWAQKENLTVLLAAK